MPGHMVSTAYGIHSNMLWKITLVGLQMFLYHTASFQILFIG